MLIMEQSSERELELVIAEPISMKAGLMLLLSGAAYFSARFLFNRTSASAVPPTSSSSSSERREEAEEEEIQSSPNSPPIGEAKNIVVDLRNREAELEMRFLLYRELKEREFKVMEMNHNLSLQMTHIDFWAREVSSMEAEAQRIGDIVTVYLQLLKKIEIYWQEKQMIQKEARKLRKILRDKHRSVRKQGCRLKARDEEISNSQKELGRKDGIIQELESEVKLMKCVVDQLTQEKIELLNKLDVEERSVSLSNPQVEGEFVEEEEYDDKLVKELEHQEKDLINQRWASACLREELMRYQRASDQEKNHSSNDHLGTQHHRRNKSEQGVVQIDWDAHEHKDYETSSEIVVTHQRFSRRRRFIRKLRGWVEGGKSDERDKHRKNVVVGEEDYCQRTSVSSL